MKSALVIITEGSEELEAVTVIDVLRRGNVSVVIAAAGEDCTVTCANGCRLVADNKLSEIISTVRYCKSRLDFLHNNFSLGSL